MRYVVTATRPESLWVRAYGPFVDLPATLAFIDTLGGMVTTYHELIEQPSDVVDGRIVGQDGLQLVGVAEAAELLNVSRQRISQLARDPRFPTAVAHLRATPVWRADQVATYGVRRFDL